ncbi:MAG: hypothetical protein J4400_01255 [Candidatus Aenigmarchaeota archaeon]|nr:hypothetical protein [Candidatus Aenigmarchaeota archaeon]
MLPKIIAALGIAAVMAGPASAQDKKIEMTAEAVVSENRQESFVRPNIFYRIGNMKAYTFFEFYRSEEYFGKTIIGKDMWKGFGPTGELVVGSDTRNRIGAGVKYSFDGKKADFSLKFLPAWFDTGGHEERVMLGYSGSLELPQDFDVSVFGEIDVDSPHGAEWGYGEISIGRNFGKFRLSYNPLLKNRDDGILKPRMEHAVCASYKF